MSPTPLNDVDVIYFDRTASSAASDIAFERRLTGMIHLPWSVKNQARMHTRNSHPPYASTSDAMRRWVEIETAVGVRLSGNGAVAVVAPLGLDRLFGGTITLNPASGNREAFRDRIATKRWLDLWPDLQVVDEAGST